jgi:hypothetical protein
VGSPASPYVGLTPYAEEDAPFFFGREAERDVITANLMAYRLTLLYGPSGAGKSSVINAGVVRKLRGLAQPHAAAHAPPEFAVIVFRTWRDNPLDGLMRAIGDEVGTKADPTWPFAAFLEACVDRAGELFVILDQFEEYFLYHPDERGAGTFASEFPRAVTRPGLRVSFLLSFREDGLAKLDRFKGRIPRLFEHYLRIDHLDRSAARAAMIRPLKEWNRRQPDHPPVGIERGLVKAVLGEIEAGQFTLKQEWRGPVASTGSPFVSKRRIEAPYLQLILQRLWTEEIRTGSNKLRLESLTRLGGAEAIVHQHLSKAMAGLRPEEQEIAARLFHYLVTPSGAKAAYSAQDLSGYAGVPQAKLRDLLERLTSSDSRILKPVAGPPDNPDEPRFEIYHDVLAGAVLEYAQNWQIARARRETEEQRQRAEKEARTAARLRFLTLGLIALFVVVVVVAGLALSFRQAATRQERLLLQEQQRALQQKLDADVREEQLRRKAQAELLKLEQQAAEQEKLGRAKQADALRQAALARRVAILAQSGGGATKSSSPSAEPSQKEDVVTIIWTGTLDPHSELKIEGAQASTGELTRPIPAGHPELIKVTPASLETLEKPSAENQWKRIRLKAGGRPVNSIIISLSQR